MTTFQEWLSEPWSPDPPPAIIHRNSQGDQKPGDQAAARERFLRKVWGKQRQGLKRCVRCGRERYISQFHRKSRARDGRSSWCIPCTKAYHRVYDNQIRGYREAFRIERGEYAA